MTKEEFLAAAARAALASSRARRFPPGITVAQAALESNWGQSQLAREAHNYFGIKAHGDHARVVYPTLEHIHGRDLRVSAEFARYQSMEECFADRDRLIATAPCYAGARACCGDPESFTRALAAHWATDPHYADKLLRVYRDSHFNELDSRSSAHPITRFLIARFFNQGATMNFLATLLRSIAFVPAIVQGVESVFGSKAGTDKKEAALNFVASALSITEAVTNKDIVNVDQFRGGLGQIIDGTVQCLNASAWAKAK